MSGVGVWEIDVGVLLIRYVCGWYCLGVVKDYLEGKLYGVEVFGIKLVVFVDFYGDLKVFDGYCWYMGGDLFEGIVKGDEVVCLFYDWCWGGDGCCKLVLYVRCIFRMVCIWLWMIDVCSGLLFVWYDYEGNLFDFVVWIFEIFEVVSDEWIDWWWNCIFIEGFNCCDIIDNVIDMVYFFYIYFGLLMYFKNVFEGYIVL